MILTLDLGTSVTKADVWSADGSVASGRAVLDTLRPGPGRVEQDPDTWWPAVVRACHQARTADPVAYADIEAIGCSAARQTIVAVSADATPIGPAIVWSDRRASDEARDLAAGAGGAESVRQRSGVHLDGTSVPAKLAWLAAHAPATLVPARWLLSPRDLLLWRMTGEVVTDSTMISASGCSDGDGALIPELVDGRGELFAKVVPPSTVVGGLLASAAAELGLRAGVPVVIGAGDRQSEVLGSGAGPTCAMVSWGTTANVSRPCPSRPHPVPIGLITTRAATDHEWLLEAGLSAAGSLLEWVAGLTGLDVATLVARAAASPPGADGLVVLPWLGGARAPWWRDDARAAVVGLEPEHGPGDLARAAIEGVARDVARGLDAMNAMDTDRPPVEALALAGAGAGVALWVEILTATTGRPATVRRSNRSSPQGAGAAAAGAALLTAPAIRVDWTLDRLDPVVDEATAGPASVERYTQLAGAADRAARAALDLASPT